MGFFQGPGALWTMTDLTNMLFRTHFVIVYSTCQLGRANGYPDEAFSLGASVRVIPDEVSIWTWTPESRLPLPMWMSNWSLKGLNKTKKQRKEEFAFFASRLPAWAGTPVFSPWTEIYNSSPPCSQAFRLRPELRYHISWLSSLHVTFQPPYLCKAIPQ